MTFAAGEKVFYPPHGAAVIERVETRTVKGQRRTYVVLRVAQADMTVHVPACSLDAVGVRSVLDGSGLDGVVGVLRTESADQTATWASLYRANAHKLRSGDVLKIAEVVRDLSRQKHAHTLSATATRLLAKARRALVSELALCEQLNEDRAEALLDQLLAP